MKRALITGARGFIGRHLAGFLRENGWNVLGLDTAVGTDCLDYFASSRATYDLIVHAAAREPHRVAIDRNKAIFPYNVMLDAAAVDWAMRTQRHGHFVYLSSAAVYPAGLQGEWGYETTADHGHTGDRRLRETDTNGRPPFDTYGEAKLLGERMIQESGLVHTIVRPFSGYGTDQSTHYPFGAFVQRARTQADPFVIWGSQRQVRDFVHIDDIVRAIVKLYEEGVKGPVNICTGIGTTLTELAYLCLEQVKFSPSVSVDPNAPQGVLHRVGDPKYLHYFYEPKITIEEGVRRAFEGK